MICAARGPARRQRQPAGTPDEFKLPAAAALSLQQLPDLYT
jgi:hypothetical protein